MEEQDPPETTTPQARLIGDQPIPSRAHDRLGRARLAEIIARQVVGGHGNQGFVVAVHGEWGSGKTSLLNMVAELVADKATVVNFNPWLFSEAEQLVDRFFGEIGAQLRDEPRLSSVLGPLSDYREVITPLAPLILGRLGTLGVALTEGAAKRKERRRGGACESYERLKSALSEADRRIVVTIDDIDRLTPHEIREVMRLVKAVGDLPNVTYLLAFARHRVEAAVGLEENGAEYLEKIVQLSHTVPPVPRSLLQTLAQEALADTLGDHEFHHFDREAWTLLFLGGVAPMLVTVRDAYRLANAAPAIVALVGDEVAGQDLLALEALRIFAPDFHSELPRMAEMFSGRDPLDARNRSEIDRQAAERVKEWLARVPEPRRAHVNEMMRTLFPGSGHLFGGSRYSGLSREWRRNRRVADPNVLAAYIHHTFSEGDTATVRLLRVVESLGNEDTLQELLADVPDQELAPLLDRVRDYEDEFVPGEMESAARAFLGLLWRMPEERELFQTPPEWTLHFTIEAFLKRIPRDQREPAAMRVVESGTSLSHRLRALNWFGAFPNREERRADGEFLSEATTGRLAEELGNAVVAADAAQLAEEHLLVRLLALTIDLLDQGTARDAITQKAAHDRFFLRLLQGCVRTGRSSGGGLTHRIVAFDWAALVHLVGEPTARQRIGELEARVEAQSLSTTELEGEAIRLAVLYAAGRGPTGDGWLRADDLSISE